MRTAAGLPRRVEALDPNLIASPTVNPERIAAPRLHALKIATLVNEGLGRIVRRLPNAQKLTGVIAIVLHRTRAIERKHARLMTPIEVGLKRVPM